MQLKWPMLWDLFSLFPAYAGVILAGSEWFNNFCAFPRIRGGDPVGRNIWWKVRPFSPHTRG